jgi:hypothetical protein
MVFKYCQMGLLKLGFIGNIQKLPQEKIFQLENKLTKSILEDLKDFLSNFNGLNIFSDSLSIWGVKTSYARTC